MKKVKSIVEDFVLGSQLGTHPLTPGVSEVLLKFLILQTCCNMWGNFYVQFINDSNLVMFVSLKKKKSQHPKGCIQSRLTLLKGCMQSTKIKVKFVWSNTIR